MSLGGRRSFSSSSDAEIPSLDKFLVKRLTRLERDVLEAKNARKKAEDEKKLIISSDEKVPDLGSVLVKHASKLEKEVEGAKTGDNRKIQRGPRVNQDFSEVLPSLDKYLVKHLTRLEREVEEEKNGEKTASFSTEKNGKENVDTNKTENKDMGSKVCRKGDFSSYGESLDKVLVKKHVSKLEKEKLSFCGDEEMRIIKPKSKAESSEGSLDQVLVKHKSRLEREKIMQVCVVHEQQSKEGENNTRHSVSRREARERELQAAWGGLSLGNSMRPHAAWMKAEEEERKRAMEEQAA
ncbi:RNA-binding (RRM/RBD/RNP motifs) family protein [Striga asiatica]|uniref:RNA-binding (RRM/RBD/RNP motifs) family protein n=1 Tax=Striga asiatica TaxID=4170 RepID=A0A5A7QKN7_STRAF|nr:RNA-binding (RRM/RBD/RNP motifs) family protein [Striga asiatica]